MLHEVHFCSGDTSFIGTRMPSRACVRLYVCVCVSAAKLTTNQRKQYPTKPNKFTDKKKRGKVQSHCSSLAHSTPNATLRVWYRTSGNSSARVLSAAVVLLCLVVSKYCDGRTLLAIVRGVAQSTRAGFAAKATLSLSTTSIIVRMPRATQLKRVLNLYDPHRRCVHQTRWCWVQIGVQQATHLPDTPCMIPPVQVSHPPQGEGVVVTREYGTAQLCKTFPVAFSGIDSLR